MSSIKTNKYHDYNKFMKKKFRKYTTNPNVTIKKIFPIEIKITKI